MQEGRGRVTGDNLNCTPGRRTETVTETTEQNETELAGQPDASSPEQHEHEHTHEHGLAMNPELRREIAVDASADEVADSFNKVVKRYQKMARIPGFRAGKVPGALIRSKFSKEVRQEVLEGLVSERFRKAIDEQQLRTVSSPKFIDMKLFELKPLRFTAAFEVMPTIEVTV